jgi:hypothetical protein
MKTIKRLIIGFIYATPLIGLTSYLVYLFITDPNMVKVIQYSGYVSIGIVFVFIFMVALLAVFSSSLMSIKHLLNLNVKDKEVRESYPASDKIDKSTDN